MFPGVNGFHWSPAHIIFLSAFGLVLSVLLVTLAVAFFRTLRDERGGRSGAIAWHCDFEDLPRQERLCRHAFEGAAPGRLCDRGFDCRDCETHPKFATIETRRPVTLPAGLDYPETRLYHRGHTWVEPQPDGTALIGLDDLGARVFGAPERVELPAPGTKLTVNGAAWRMMRNGASVSVRSPLEGEVVAQGAPGGQWQLKVKPEAGDRAFRHLLSGADAHAWVNAETDRLMILLSSTPTGAALADGGALVTDLHQALPDAPWDEVSAAMFLNC
ncbi:MAG: hypothetical protein IPJ98_28550 [Bryobacterales bacterium]|nr:hypothetical protein [Bryobacterales bacterium]